MFLKEKDKLYIRKFKRILGTGVKFPYELKIMTVFTLINFHFYLTNNISMFLFATKQDASYSLLGFSVSNT